LIPDLLGLIQDRAWSAALADSIWVWPLTESAHVLLIGVFLGTVLMMGLRLVGAAYRSVPVSAFTGRLLPWTRRAFAGMATTGVPLFLATPRDYYENPFFRAGARPARARRRARVRRGSSDPADGPGVDGPVAGRGVRRAVDRVLLARRGRSPRRDVTLVMTHTVAA